MPNYIEVQALRDEIKECQDRMWLAMGAHFGTRLDNYPPKERDAELYEWKKANGAMFCSDKLAEMLMQIPRNYGKRANFVGYTFVDDMIAEAQLELIATVWWKFNTSLDSSPFAYFTQCTHNRFVTILKKEKNGRDILLQLRRFEGLDDPFTEQARREHDRQKEEEGSV